MKLLINLLMVLPISLFSSYGIQIGMYNTKPAIPLKVQQLQLPTQIINTDGKYKLIVGPFKTSLQANQAKNSFGLDGFILEYNTTTFTNKNSQKVRRTNVQKNRNIQRLQVNTQQYAVEILSAKSINSVPRRIINKIFQMNLKPAFIMDKGMYRLVVGPMSDKLEAMKISDDISNIFGTQINVIKVSRSKFNFAHYPSPKNTKSKLNINSTDNSEHLSYLEKQRRNAVRKYNINPFGPTKQIRPYQYFQESTISQQQEVQDETPSVKVGAVFSVISESSKNSLMVNGKKIGGNYSKGGQMGVKIGDNTIIQLGYVTPEIKKTTIYLSDKQLVDITSTYSLMFSSDLKYRYFLPKMKNIFFSLQFGLSLVKQNILSMIPINFGKAYTYNGWYIQPSIGFGMGFRLSSSLSLGVDYISYFTLKTINTNVKFSFSYEL
jgi:hypothetical protein